MLSNEYDDYYKNYLLAKVAWFYYVDNLTQKEIASIMNTSRLTINKMLEEARQNDVIQFYIPLHHYQKLGIERQISDKYGLADTFIIPSIETEIINSALGKAAAYYVKDLLGTNSYVNLGYGDTINHFITHLSNISSTKISMVSLTGGVSQYLPNDRLGRFNVGLNLIPAPIILENESLVENLVKEPSLMDIYSLSELASITVIGIGEVTDTSTIIKQNLITINEMKKLHMRGAVADILMHFIDADGHLIQSDIERKLISTSLARLQKMENVIAVAGGEQKVVSIDAALKTKTIDRLVTTEETALKLLERS